MDPVLVLTLHKWSAILFVTIYLFKLAGLFGVAYLDSFFQKKPMRILEMVISASFLITGIWRFTSIPESSHTTLLYIKIAMVFMNIPLAVVAYKRRNKLLAAVSMILLLGTYGLAEANKRRPVVADTARDAVAGPAIYQSANCGACHGADGKAGIAGAKDLSTSQLADEDIRKVISKGNAKGMPGYGKQLAESQIAALAEYVKTLRK
ncbi:MAG: cytochrome c [Bacteroidia bacterium]|nr:cytochrome c [Bacteroidia bacterium]